MKFLKKSVLILVLPLFAFTVAHKYYLSVTNIAYSEKDDALQITTRIFIDDLENLLKERYNVVAHLSTDLELKNIDAYFEKYLRAKFELEINGEIKPYDVIGREYDSDVIIFYLEVSKVDFSSISTIQVKNEVLTDLYDEQQNIVHFKLKGKKNSFVLAKPDTKGMLNL